MTERKTPQCHKCHTRHWRFDDCPREPGKQSGYDTLLRTSDYQRLQYRSRQRVHYRQDDAE